jgi:hypothetical protein
MNNIENKILQAIKSNKLNPEILGGRNWYNYYIITTELVWARNLFDGYKIEVYSDSSKLEHLITLKV